ncbi:DJ-1 protein-PfpI domain-containing protein [Mycena indigotica]|uniref:DJ-1 protein-PfpI domain-containing protein n=1 Tax=Mycena indigotica TaxID=2126181 RepID=A0A8H6WGB8_9AGAR|nr:DJ-1 protein-PfpI domain-containing protein [Mycena indigotica]KAF7315676.1 DJ-1 protein-PfpI domain-containing protein [Mycena indigotica]
MSQASLTVAVCLFPRVTTTDYQGPVELLGLLSAQKVKPPILAKNAPNFTIDITYLSHTLEPVQPIVGPRVQPDRTYDDAQEQFDIILVPGGPMVNPPSACNDFIKRQSPGAKYILSVCTGSLVLARLGLLNGHSATTNKSAFRAVQAETKDLPITWVEKARWVVSEDKKIWTASGITAGMDMAGGFLDHIAGKEYGLVCRSFLEMSVKNEGDDEFAAYHGLV